MRKRIPIKNHHLEIKLVTQRTTVALIFIILMVIVLLFRLANLQINKRELYTTLATNNWLDLVPIEPTRGLIYDRNGVLLAENIPIFSLDIIPNEVSDLPKTLKELSKFITLSENDIHQFHKLLKQHRRFDEIPLKLKLTEAEVARMAENQHRFSGLVIKARLMRHYPFGESFSHVLGYVGRINTQELTEIDAVNYSASYYIGKLGIEKFYEDDLHGEVGYEQVEKDASGKPIRTLKEIKGTPGKNIYLTIDSRLQFIAEKALENHRGAIVALDANSGQVLAMVSKPGYDPNIFVQGISRQDYRLLQTSEDRPLFNRALRGLYPMASTIKPFYALQGLNLGIVTPDMTIYDPGWFELPNGAHTYHDWQHQGHGTVNISRAIIGSCDTFFYQLALKMGIHNMSHILSQFGFGELSGIDLDDELPGTVATPEWKRKMRGVHWYMGDTIISGIGQGYMQTTPLQLASAVSTLANRGKRFVPYLQLGEQLPGKPYIKQEPIPLEPVTLQNNTAWDIVIHAMQDVVASPQGTAFRFGQRHAYSVAGKTGTAQVVAKRGDPNKADNQAAIPERLRDHHLFIAFAPVEKPRIALAIITENSSVAIEAARSILDTYFGTDNYAHREPQAQTQT